MLKKIVYERKKTYFCKMDYSVPYTVLSPLSTEKQANTQKVVECCGELLPADADVLQHFMTEKKLTFEEQMAHWHSFYLQLSDPEWAHICMARISDVERILAFDRSHFPASVKSASSVPSPQRPLSPTAERHFVWLGDRFSISIESLRNGISQLAAVGLISSNRDQQIAFRRCLGIAVNEEERTTNQSWVRWLGPDDMLKHLIASLWQLGVIYTPGGERQKWKTLCGCILRGDGQFYKTTIRSNSCTNIEKIRILDHAILDSMRFHCKK